MDLVGDPEGLLPEILKRLPVKSLRRFMCVSKPWNHLITDPSFVTSHLQFTKQSSPSHAVLGINISRGRNGKDHDQRFDYFLIDSTKKTTLEHQKIQFPWKPKPDPKQKPKRQDHVTLLGHCNGPVLVQDHVEDRSKPIHREFQINPESGFEMPHLPTNVHERLIICNPITRRFQILPESGIEIPLIPIHANDDDAWEFIYKPYKKLEAFGFGFVDDVTYKVVRLTYGRRGSSSDERKSARAHKPVYVEVYDSRSCSWKMIPRGEVNHDFSYARLDISGVYNPHERCLYWLGSRERYVTLVSFDLAHNKLNETLFPYKEERWSESDPKPDYDGEDDVFGAYKYCQSVTVLGESVVMFVGDQRNVLEGSVWKMNKNEDKVSWTYMYRFNFRGSPLGFCGDGELLLMMESLRRKHWKKLVLFDLKKTDDACFGFTELGFKLEYIVSDYVESLVLRDEESEVIVYVPEEPVQKKGEENGVLSSPFGLFDNNVVGEEEENGVLSSPFGLFDDNVVKEDEENGVPSSSFGLFDDNVVEEEHGGLLNLFDDNF